MMNFASVLQGFGSALDSGDEERRRREEEERRRREQEQQRLAALQQQQQQLRARIDAQAPVDYSLPGAAAPVSPQDLAAQQQRLMASTATDTGEVPGVTTQPPAPPAPALGTGLSMPTATQARAFMPTPAVANTRPTSLTTRFVTAADSGDRDELMRISTDTAAPEWLRRQSADEAYRIMDRERQTRAAEKQVANAVSQGDLSPIQRELRRSGEEGSIFRAVLYGALNLTDLAAREQQKLGAGTRWITARDNQGRPALIQTRADGLPITGYNETGAVLGEQDLLRYASAAAGGKITTSGQFFETPTGQILRAQSDEAGGTRLVDAATGQRYTGNTQGLRTVSEAGGVRRAAETAQINLDFAGVTAAARAGGDYIGQFNAAQGTNLAVRGYDPQTRAPIIVDQNTGQQIRPNAAGQATATRSVSPAATAAPAPAPAPTAPTGAASPAQVLQRQELQKNLQNTLNTETVKANMEEGKLAREAAKGSVQNIALANRVFEATQRNPQFFDILRSPAYRAFVAAQTDGDRRAALERLSATTNIPADQRTEFARLVGDLRAMELAGITSSGLSASQLNSENEAARAVQAVSVSLTDPAATAASQALLFRARNEYQRRWSDYLARAPKTQDPGITRQKFDAEWGEQYWQDINEQVQRLVAPRTQTQSVPVTGTGIRILDRRPIQ